MCFPVLERITGAISEWIHIMSTKLLWKEYIYGQSMNTEESFHHELPGNPYPLKTIYFLLESLIQNAITAPEGNKETETNHQPIIDHMPSDHQ